MTNEKPEIPQHGSGLTSGSDTNQRLPSVNLTLNEAADKGKGEEQDPEPDEDGGRRVRKN